MRFRTSLLPLVIFFFVGAGCAPAARPIEELPSAPPPPAEQPSVRRPYYIAFADEEYQAALAEHRPVLLYFWASWCPICRAEEPGIRAAVEAMDVPVAGFRVNFDVESALKKQFKIPYQHTTVILDTRGQESSRFSGPVDGDTLRAAIRAAAK